MTREEAATMMQSQIDRIEECQAYEQQSEEQYHDGNRRIEMFRIGIKALRGPVPDPSTGLVPCGCGGKALYYLMPNIDAGMMSIYAVCPECGERSGTVVGMYDLSADGIKMIVRDAWNRAMGYREKPLNATPENNGME